MTAPVCGLVLMGGGARGAYQAGVIRALATISGPGSVPFPIISGVSVGALNAAALGSSFLDFERAAQDIEHFWRTLNSQRVFRTSTPKMLATLAGLGLGMTLPHLAPRLPRALLDNAPLRAGLSGTLRLSGIRKAIRSGKLKAIGLTSSCYSTGHAVTFFEAGPGTPNWRRVRRDGMRCHLTLDHALASAALPLLFDAVQIGPDYYGDGMLRLTSPLAPAIHMGATKLLTIANAEAPSLVPEPTPLTPRYPTFGDLGGFALDTIFNDNLDADIERLHRINTVLHATPNGTDAKSGLRQIDILSIRPTRSVQEIALSFRRDMPRMLRWALGRSQSRPSAGRMESYLLFERRYIDALFALGHADAMARQAEIRAFLTG
ncbi:patatin-like phospholipase family protein [Pseudoruegeria sp. SK021]|uniref:patatin-like phospholipase family protein n=1 Tax=Pseudoruegeria sp. SK021 TaxID=1933035 RepID=UPI000A25A23C|nr:patatin-like phospholipase family protein [Pseudoruegeria sp. SK021]OSP54592.1 hypothetical protein BV911_12080 [Pseudoruegeria sp. SK021]